MDKASLNDTFRIYFFYGSEDSYSSIACARENLISHGISQESKISTDIFFLFPVSDTKSDNFFYLVRIVYEQHLSFVSFTREPVSVNHNMFHPIEDFINMGNSARIEAVLDIFANPIFFLVFLISKLAGRISLSDIFF